MSLNDCWSPQFVLPGDLLLLPQGKGRWGGSVIMAHFLVSDSLFSQPKFRNWEKEVSLNSVVMVMGVQTR